MPEIRITNVYTMRTCKPKKYVTKYTTLRVYIDNQCIMGFNYRKIILAYDKY